MLILMMDHQAQRCPVHQGNLDASQTVPDVSPFDRESSIPVRTIDMLLFYSCLTTTMKPKASIFMEAMDIQGWRRLLAGI